MKAIPGIWLLCMTIAVAAADAPKQYINLEKGEHGERTTLPVWKSEDAMKECMVYSFKRLTEEMRNKAFEGGPCADGRVADLAHGTVVEPLEPSAECGTLAKVRIASGTAAGKVACAPRAQVRPTLDP